MTLFNFDLEEKEAYGAKFIIGTDEAGRGPAAGGVWAAAVYFRPNVDEELFKTLNDSKKLSSKKREALFDEIQEKALSFSIIMESPAVIDEINI